VGSLLQPPLRSTPTVKRRREVAKKPTSQNVNILPLSPRTTVNHRPATQSAATQRTQEHFEIRDDALGELIRKSVGVFQQSKDWESFVQSVRAPPDLPSNVGKLPHPASRLLDHLRAHGAPIPTSTGPWSKERRNASVLRGSHQSANEHSEFVREEFKDFMDKQFWTILPYRLVQHLKDLRMSPLGVVPQRDRRPRLIVDLSFFGINQECVPVAPAEAMQFGRTLQRLMQRILDADPQFGPVYMAKIDISDGFYRIGLAPRDAPKLGVLLPRYSGEEPMIAIPLVLPMGWVNAPPYFCAATETAADLMNADFRNEVAPPSTHRLQALAATRGDLSTDGSAPTPLSSRRPTTFTRPLKYADVYVDDFIGLVQGTPEQREVAHRVLFHNLDKIFRPLARGESGFRQEPASVKKLKKGDAAWSTRKQVLGWILNTAKLTLELPSHRRTRLLEILQGVTVDMKRCGVKRWRKILGELRSMMIAIPGSRGLFSVLQYALKYNAKGKAHRVRLSQSVHYFLSEFRRLAADLQARSTHLAELVPNQPSVVGATDASGAGMGGVAFVNLRSGVVPIVWRSRFPDYIVKRLVSFGNPTGTVSNSDLELAGTIGQHDVIAAFVDMKHQTQRNLHDNTPSQFWQQKGSASTEGAAAHLLHIQSFHQRHHRYYSQHGYIPGPLNVMADEASRMWKLSDDEFLAHFNRIYPQPVPWQLHQLRSEMRSCLISALLRQKLGGASFRALNKRPTVTGTSGSNIVPSSGSTPCYMPSPIPFPSFKSSPVGIASGKDPPASPSGLAQFRMQSGRLARRWPAWGPRT